jgi:hypothetical protein
MSKEYKKKLSINDKGKTVLNFDDECWGPKAEAISIWHFNPTIVDKMEDVTKSPCHFRGDWTSDIEAVTPLLRETVTYDVDFWKDLGYPRHKLNITQTTPALNYNDFPKFKKIVDYLSLKIIPEYPVRVLVFRQLPGQILPSHIDNYKKAKEEKTSEHALKAVRFAVALNDWNIGHYWHFGNAVWQQWKAGDCIHWHRTMAHGTANVGHTPRWTLQITGIPSNKTFELLEKNDNHQVLV